MGKHSYKRLVNERETNSLGFNHEFFESAEFYHRRFNNFSSLVIIPVAILLSCILLFSFCARREVTIKALGEIEPSSHIIHIQSLSNERVMLNHLAENKYVSRGEILLEYNQEKIQKQIAHLREQQRQLSREKTALRKTQKGFHDLSLPQTPDEFGFANLLNEYEAKRNQIIQESDISNSNTARQNSALASSRQSINNQIDSQYHRISAYKQLQSAISLNQPLSRSNMFFPTYKLYKDQEQAIKENRKKSGSSLGEQMTEEQLTNQILAKINESINQLNDSIGALKTQLANAQTYVQNDATVKSKLDALTAQYNLDIDQRLSEVQAKKIDIDVQCDLITLEQQQSILRAPASGVLHVAESAIGASNIPTGTVVADLYPPLDQQSNVDIVIPIPVQKIDGIHIGQQIRLSEYQSTSTPLILQGIIRQIPTSPTTTAHGNIYIVKARARIKPRQAIRLRYGFQGNVVIITGTKTFFNYYKDKILHPYER